MSIKRLVWLAILALLLAPSTLVHFRTRPAVPAVSAAAVAPGAAVAPPAMPETLSTVYFAAGTTQIRPRDMSILDAHAVWQRDQRKRVLVIVQSRDRRATGPGRQGLSGDQGGADHIRTESRGGGRPMCKDKTPVCRALNRRATVSREVGP